MAYISSAPSYSVSGGGLSNLSLILIAAALALIGAILIYLLIMPKKKDGKMGNPFLQWLHDFFHFKKLYIESILRFTFCFVTLLIIFVGFISLFVAGDPVISLAVIVAGPIAARLVYEMLLMIFIGIRNIMDINNKLPDLKKQTKDAPVAEVTPAAPAVCPNCGTERTAENNFCVNCGTKLV